VKAMKGNQWIGYFNSILTSFSLTISHLKVKQICVKTMRKATRSLSICLRNKINFYGVCSLHMSFLTVHHFRHVL
jgi:hypothetical protein